MDEKILVPLTLVTVRGGTTVKIAMELEQVRRYMNLNIFSWFFPYEDLDKVNDESMFYNAALRDEEPRVKFQFMDIVELLEQNPIEPLQTVQERHFDNLDPEIEAQLANVEEALAAQLAGSLEAESAELDPVEEAGGEIETNDQPLTNEEPMQPGLNPVEKETVEEKPKTVTKTKGKNKKAKRK